MDPGTKRGLLVALLIAAITLTACVVRTAPASRHRHQHVRSHEKHEPVKHKKHRKQHRKH